MATTVTYTNETFDRNGNLTATATATVDITTFTNAQTLLQRAQAALTTNASFLAIATPTNAQVLAQVQALTKECSALIRLLLGQFDSTAGT